MSKVRDLPELVSLEQDDLVYAVEEDGGPNGGRKVKISTIQTAVLDPAAVKVSYESNADTNAFTDAEKTKLAGVETGATADQIASEVPYSNFVSGLTATNVKDAIDEVNVHAQADFRPSIVSGRILHYTGGTVRFDGIFYQLVANDILLNSSITNGEVYVDLDGIVKQTGSGILAPPYTVVFAKFSTDLNDIISLTDERVKNAQNIIRGLLTDVRDVRAGAAASEGTSGRVSDAMHKHNILTAAPSTQTPDQANAEGTSTSLARADHVHNIPADAPTIPLSPAVSDTEGSGSSFSRNDHTHSIATGLVGEVAAIMPDDAAAAGVVDKFARIDHQHAISTDAPTTNLSPATTNTEGVGTSFARNDHTHAIETSLVGDITTVNAGDVASAGIVDKFARGDHEHAVATATPSAQAPDQANAEGISTSLARADHIHNIPADAPTTTLSPVTSNAEGSGVAFARNDHQHAVATGLVGEITAIQPDDAAAAGTVDKFARADHKHAIATGTPATQNPDQANAEGVSTSFARADHIHNIPAAAPTTPLSPATTDTEGVGTSFARNDHTHSIATGLVGDITSIDPDDGPSAGVIDRFARADHQHAIVAAAPATQNPDQANAEGVATSFSRSDHVHNIPAAAPITTLDPTTTNAEGTGTSFARNDHTHAIATGVDGDVTTILPDDAASTGSIDRFARAGHRHAISTVAATSVSTSTTNTEGAGNDFARATHTHAVTVVSSEATATADDTTTSATDTLMNSMTLTPGAGTYLAMWSGATVNSGNGAERTFISLYANGSQVTATERVAGVSGGAYSPMATQAVITVAAAQAIELRWRVTAGTSTVHSRRLTLIRLSN